ncbi:MAG: hydroxysqualene dehydroxylase HpnE [Acidimicrobiales bacterium]
MTKTSVVVIGGGLAGISAALAAADAGADVTLLERQARLGGLTWSFQRKGLWFDNGQHVFLRCCTAYRQFIERIEATHHLHLQDRLAVPVLRPITPTPPPTNPGVDTSPGVNARSAVAEVADVDVADVDGAGANIAGVDMVEIRRNGWPAPFHLMGSLARYRHLPTTDRLRVGRAVLALSRLNLDDPGLDAINFGQWLSRHGQSDRAIEVLWNLIALPTLNIAAGDASMAVAAKVFRTGLLDSTDGGDIGWSKVPLARLHHESATKALSQAGVDVLLGSRVRALGIKGGTPFVVETFDQSLAADAVIVATPPPTARELLPEGALPDLDLLGTSPIVNVHLVLDRQVTDLPMAAAIDSPVQFVFDRTKSSGLEKGQYLAVSLSAADAYLGVHPHQLISMFSEALGQLFPPMCGAEIVDGVVSRERAATFRAVPGTKAYRPPNATATEGLFLAGAWCDTGWPATMEGAVRSGLAAGQQAAGVRTRQAPAAMPGTPSDEFDLVSREIT